MRHLTAGIILALTLASCLNDRGNIDAAFVEQLFDKEQYHFAIEQSNKVLKNDSNNINILALRARSYMNIHSYDSAIYDLQWLIQKTSDSTLFCFIGECYFAMGKHESAARAFRRATPFVESLECSKLGLAVSFDGLGEADSALKYADELLMVDSTNESARAIVARWRH